MARSSDWNLGKGAWALLDLAAASLSAALVPLYWSPLSETLRAVSTERLAFYALFYGFSFLVAGEMLGFHESRTHRSWRFRMAIGVMAVTGACFALLLLVYFVEFRFVGRFALLKIGGCSVGVTLILRAGIGRMASLSRPKVLPLLPREVVEDLMQRVERVQVPVKLEDPEDWRSENKKDFVAWCRERDIDEVVTLRGSSGKENAEEASADVVALMAAGTRVSDLVDFWERSFARIPPEHVDEAWLTRLDLRLRHPVFHRAKRCLDVVVAVVGLVLASPILFLSGLVIALESGFPILYAQRRTGFLGRDFTLLKLRTMKTDAEKQGAKWASKGDVRATRVGKFLRRSRIDEIPQFWNVLKGEMSIVGPRPERPEFVEKLNQEIPLWPCRHLVKPGLSGWAQIRFRYAADRHDSKEKLAYDLYYLKNASLLLDLQIILSTLRSVAKGSR